MPDRQLFDVGSLAATLTDVFLPFGLTLDRLELTGDGLHVEKDPFDLTMSKPGGLVAIVSESSIKGFLDKKAPPSLSGFSISIKDGKMTVIAIARIFMPIRVAAVCTLEIVAKRQLFVRLQAVGLGEPVRKMVQAQLDQINPVLDVNHFPVAAELDSVTVDAGVVRLEGRLLGVK